MYFSESSALRLIEEYKLCESDFMNTWLGLIQYSEQHLKNARAIEFMKTGIGRRMQSTIRCSEQIFKLFPPNTIRPLKKDVLEDVNIYFQTFVINIYGILDNIAWVLLLEKESPVVNNPITVGLKRKETLAELPDRLRSFLTDDFEFHNWYTDYAKKYRDNTAHRIPFYIAPFSIDPKNSDRYKEIQLERMEVQKAAANALGENPPKPLSTFLDKLEALDNEDYSYRSPVFISINDGDKRHLIFHPQIICDLKTINQLLSIAFPKLQKASIFPMG